MTMDFTGDVEQIFGTTEAKVAIGSVGVAICAGVVYKIYNGLKGVEKAEVDQIKKAFTNFIVRAEVDGCGGLARQMLDHINILGDGVFNKIDPSSFENANLFKLAGVHDGSGSMRPKSLGLAVKIFWAETAASGAHKDQTYFTNDPIPRLTLAITAIVTYAFRFQTNVTAKKEWLLLLTKLLAEIRSKECVAKKGAFGPAVTRLQKKLLKCVKELKIEESERAVSETVESMSDTTSNIVSLMGSVIGELHQEAVSWWPWNKEEKAKEKNAGVHIGLVDGLTPLDYITLCQQLLGLFNNSTDNIDEGVKPNEKFFITEEAVIAIQKISAVLFPEQEKKRIFELLSPKNLKKENRLYSCDQNTLRELTSLFSTSFLESLKQKKNSNSS